MLFKDKNPILEYSPAKIAGVFNSQVAIHQFLKNSIFKYANTSCYKYVLVEFTRY